MPAFCFAIFTLNVPFASAAAFPNVLLPAFTVTVAFASVLPVTAVAESLTLFTFDKEGAVLSTTFTTTSLLLFFTASSA